MAYDPSWKYPKWLNKYKEYRVMDDIIQKAIDRELQRGELAFQKAGDLLVQAAGWQAEAESRLANIKGLLRGTHEVAEDGSVQEKE